MNYALGLRRHDLRILVDLLTGHSTLSKHVHYAQCVEKWRKPPSFPRTKVLFHYDHETRIMAAYTLQLEELRKVSPSNLLW